MNDITELKNGFSIVKGLRNDILNVLETLDSKVTTLHRIYLKLLGLHNESAYMFGIDSFYFQNKLIETELRNLKDILQSIDNRMYCEYYQLYMLIQNYVLKDVASVSVRKKLTAEKKYPAYKNLDHHVKYDFCLVSELHEKVILSIMELETYRQEKVTELETDTVQSNLGLNIGNLVNSHLYYNAMLKEKIGMFTRFMKVFHEHHTKYFTRLNIKAKLVIGIINEDIQIKQFNPTGDGVVPHNTLSTTSPTTKHASEEEHTIRSFVDVEDSNNGEVLKSTLDTIVSNIKIKSGESRGMNAPGNNSPV